MSSHELDAVAARSEPVPPPAPRRRTRSRPPEAWDENADLRRKRRREYADVVVRRADLLPPHDAALLRAIFSDGKSIAEVAALAQIAVARLRRYVHRLLRRVLSPRFEYVVRHARGWDAERRRVAQHAVVLGQPLRQVARDLGLSLYAVRRHYQSITTLYEESLAAPAAVVVRPRRSSEEGSACA